MLTPAQLQTLRTAIDADPALTALPRNDDTAFQIAAAFNVVGTFIVRRKRVNSAEIGPVLNYVAVSFLTTANRDRATTFLMLNPESFEPTADVESYWETTFGGALGGQGQATRDALVALWRRAATRGEALYATGTGTAPDPGTLVYEGSISPTDVTSARNL
jgi:hypothetical protein